VFGESGERQLTLEHIRYLAKRFGVSPLIFSRSNDYLANVSDVFVFFVETYLALLHPAGFLPAPA